MQLEKGFLEHVLEQLLSSLRHMSCQTPPDLHRSLQYVIQHPQMFHADAKRGLMNMENCSLNYELQLQEWVLFLAWEQERFANSAEFATVVTLCRMTPQQAAVPQKHGLFCEWPWSAQEGWPKDSSVLQSTAGSHVAMQRHPRSIPASWPLPAVPQLPRNGTGERIKVGVWGEPSWSVIEQLLPQHG